MHPPAPRLLAAALLIAACAPAHAQWAEIEVSTPELGLGLSDPIPITVTVRWSGAIALAEVRGSIVVTPGSGNPENFTTTLTGAIVNTGVFSGLSRIGFNAASIPPLFTGGVVSPPWGNAAGVVVARYDVRIGDPGFYYVRWVPDGGQGVTLWPNASTTIPLAAPVSNISDRFFVGCCPGPLCSIDLTISANPAHAWYGLPGGGLTNDDFFFYLARFAVGDRNVCDLTTAANPGSPGYGIPNGVLNNDDFFFYLAKFTEGC